MSKKGILSLSLLLFVGIAMFVGSRVEREIHFSNEVLASFPGCTESKAMFEAKDNFSVAEFEKMKSLAEKCNNAQLDHLESSPSPEGVTFEYGFR